MKAVALLSGGLDSVVSMLLAREEAEIIMALTVDYGQKAWGNELKAAQMVCDAYRIPHKSIVLPFMKDLHSGIIEGSGISEDNPWVPNRNGLFINLAAAYAEDMGASLVICGFNRDEGIDFPDNTREYVNAVNSSLFYSTLNHVKVKSFVQEMSKVEIVKKAKELGVDFSLIWSCYRKGPKPCGECPSCVRNKEAYEKAGVEYDQDFIC
jgi:7-cyano-7-deazaguanine synthase